MRNQSSTFANLIRMTLSTPLSLSKGNSGGEDRLEEVLSQLTPVNIVVKLLYGRQQWAKVAISLETIFRMKGERKSRRVTTLAIRESRGTNSLPDVPLK